MSALKAVLVRGACLGLLACTGCAGWKPVAKTVDQAAVILCDIFESQQPANASLSIDDIEKAFCATAEQVAPFLDAAHAAVSAGGKAREAEGK
jgi:hypothetical protein